MAVGDAVQEITRDRFGREAQSEIWTDRMERRGGEDLKGKKRREI